MEKTPGASSCNPKGLFRGHLTNIEDGLELSVSDQAKDRISGILENIESLSDVEKLLLYLKLPTGSASEDVLRQTPTSFLHASNRLEQAQAFTWIRSHLEEDSQICVPKHEVYDEYRSYCESHGLKSLCAADFGKVLKCIFPNVKPRRLGQRGQSRYCYSGLRKKLDIQPPSLPELEISPKKPKTEDLQESELFSASCQLVCEWAGKLLSRAFSSLRELSEYLVGNLYVNSKSTAAFTVLAAMQEAGLHNSRVPVSPLFTCSSGGDKHRETQLQLQRKLQERELLKEQKKKLQQQRSEIEQEQLRSSSRGPSATPTKSPLPRSFSKTPTPIKSPVLRPPSSVAMKSPGPQVVAFRQTPTPTNTIQNASKCAARNLTKMLQSPVHLGKPVARQQDVKAEPNAESASTQGSADRTRIMVSLATPMTVTPATSATVASSLSPPSSTAFTKTSMSGVSYMQTDKDASDSSSSSTITDRTAAPTVLLSTVNGVNIVSGGGRQFIFSGSQGLILDDSASSNSALMKNGMHMVQKPLVVPACGSGTSSQQTLPTSQQMQSVSASSSVTIASTGISPSVTKLEAVPTQGIAIVSKPKEVSAERTCGEIESVAPADLDKCRVENINFIPGNLSTRSAFVPVSNQKLAFTLISPTVSRVMQTSESSSDESKDQDDSSVPMDQSENLGHSGGFEPQTFTSRASDPILGPSAMQTSDSYSSGQSSSGIPTSSAQQSQKKVKNRFTPIRPKASQTVTSFQKDQKTPEKDSRPVSALLKEKRAREAKGVYAHVASLQGEAVGGKNFPASISLPAEVLGLSPSKSNSGNEVVIILTSPSSGSSKFTPAQREGRGPGEEKQSSRENPSSVALSMSDFLMANPNFVQHKDAAATSSSSAQAQHPVSVLQLPGSMNSEMLDINVGNLKLPVVLARQGREVQVGTVRRDSGCLDVSDSSEMENTDEEVTQHMERNTGHLLPDNRDTDTPSSRKRKCSGQGNADQTHKRLNSDKRTETQEDDDVFIVEPSLDLQTDSRMVAREVKQNSARQSIVTLEVPFQTAVRRLEAGSPYVRPGSSTAMHMQVCEPVSRCQSTGLGGDEPAYVLASDLPRQVRGKLSVESLESDALLDSGHMPVGRDLVKHTTISYSPVHIEQKASVGISARTRAVTQQDLLQSKQELDDRFRSFLSKSQSIPSISVPTVISSMQPAAAVSATTSVLHSQTQALTLEMTEEGSVAGFDPKHRLSDNVGDSSALHIGQASHFLSTGVSRVQDASMNVDTYSEELSNIPSSIFELMGLTQEPSSVQAVASSSTDTRTQGSIHHLLMKGSAAPGAQVSPQQVPTQRVFPEQFLSPEGATGQPSPANTRNVSATRTATSLPTSQPQILIQTPKVTKSKPAPAAKSGPTQPVNLLALLKSPALSALDKPGPGAGLLSSRELNASSKPVLSTVQVHSHLLGQENLVSPSTKATSAVDADSSSVRPPSVDSGTTKVSPNVNISFMSGGTAIQNVFSTDISSGGLTQESAPSVDQPPSFLDMEPEGELPADVAEFVAEAMTARDLKFQQNRESLLMLNEGYLQNFLLQPNTFVANSGVEQPSGSSVGDVGVNSSQKDTFTMPSNPAPKQRLSESGSASAKKYPPVQRSASLPVFVPRAPAPGASMQQEVPSPSPSPTGTANSPRAPTPLSAASATSGVPARRLRQTAVERISARTPSDAGYHSFDASPLMPAFTPLPPPSSTPTQEQITVNVAAPVTGRRTTSASVRSDSAQSVNSEGLHALPQGSPLASAGQGVMSTSSSVSGYSPVDPAAGSPNAFMPIQVSSAGRSASGVQQQYIEPIRPMVTLASMVSPGQGGDGRSVLLTGGGSGSLTMMLSANSQGEGQEISRLSQAGGALLSPEYPAPASVGSPSVRSVSSDPGSGAEQSIGASRLLSSSPRPGTVPYNASSPATPRGSYPPGISPGPSPTPGTSNACSPSPSPAASRSTTHGVLQKLLSTRSNPPSYAESVQQRRLSAAQVTGSQVVSSTSDTRPGSRSAGEKLEQHAGQFMVPLVSAEDVKQSRAVIHHIPTTTASSTSGTTSERSSRRIAILKRDSAAKSTTKSAPAPKVAAAASDSILKASLASPTASSDVPMEYPFSYSLKLALLRQQSMTQPDSTQTSSVASSQPSSTATGSSQSQTSASAVLAASLASMQKQVKSGQTAETPSGGNASQTQSSGSGASSMASSPSASVSVSVAASQQQLTAPLRVSTSSQSQRDIFLGLPATSPLQRLNPFSPQQSSPSSSSSTSSTPLSSGLTLPTSGHPMGALYLPFNLPDMNYMGNAPNIDLSQLSFLSRKTSPPDAAPPPQPASNSSLSETGFEDELQSTLDILRNIDGQYFNQDVEGDGSESEGAMMLMQSVFCELSQEPDMQGVEEEGEREGEEESSDQGNVLKDSSV